ncbi:carboxypeptidase N subunit 2-like [Patiria miniata]|uniref:Ig-like domain-containing protein n=1 Tax=Patiria miniata TaxID=46514 RepID=A0A914A0G5_PATMI|nr:carboxypeptidase N subunit 2-like [Patiria miniata]
MASFNSSHSSRSFRIRLLLMGLLILSQEAHSICPSVCRCGGQYASCGYQNLSAIPVGLPDDIRTLYLDYNQLTKLAAGDFSSLSQLEQLYLYNNHISVIEDGAFRGLASLKLLSLESNNIGMLTNRTFEEVPNLEELHLRNNRLSSLTSGVFSQVPRLRELDLASNDIGEFPTDVSRDLMNVEILDLSYNPASLLLTPVFGQMVALQHLKLNDLFAANSASVEDSIPDSAFDGLSNLRNLELKGNRLTKIPAAVKTLPNLTTVSLYLNSIQSVNADDFYRPSLLEWLHLEYNSLVEIPTSALAEFQHLTDLYLNYNHIPVIPSLAFLHNPRLAILHMSYTNLTTIEKDAFVGLGRLETLYLKGNNLTTIVDGAMNHVNPNVNLEISGNPIRCDCHLRGFAAWLKNNHTGSLIGGSSLQCVTPDRLNDTSVAGLLPNQFACAPRSPFPTLTISAVLETKVLLPCRIDADPALYTYWITSSHEEISPEQPHPPFAIADNGSLLVTNVSISNEGLYTCVVSNDAGEARSSLNLHILLSAAKPIKSNNISIVYICVAGGILIFVVLLLLVLLRRGIIARNMCIMDNEENEHAAHQQANAENIDNPTASQYQAYESLDGESLDGDDSGDHEANQGDHVYDHPPAETPPQPRPPHEYNMNEGYNNQAYNNRDDNVNDHEENQGDHVYDLPPAETPPQPRSPHEHNMNEGYNNQAYDNVNDHEINQGGNEVGPIAPPPLPPRPSALAQVQAQQSPPEHGGHEVIGINEGYASMREP